jgi:curved DNA-binding protein CbpA
MPTHYDILEVRPEASAEDIRRAYRRLSKQYHPDVNGGAHWAGERFKRLHQAYSLLIDAEQRRVYDLHIQTRTHSPSSTSGYSNNTKASAGQWKSARRQRNSYKKRSNPYSIYFFLFGIFLALLTGRLWLSPASPLGFSESSSTSFSNAEPLPSTEALEFLDFYKEYPQLINPSEAHAVFSTPLPEGFTETLKCYLMEGDMAAFRNHLQRPGQ